MEIQAVHTACRGCCFAIPEEGTQTGCILARAEMYEDQGCLVDAYDENGNEFFIVNGRICAAKRSPEWASRQTDVVEAVRNEIRTKLTVVVFVGDGLEETVKSLLGQEVLPHEVFFVATTGAAPLSLKLRELIGEVPPFTWKVSLIDAPPRTVVDTLFPQFTGHFYALFRSGFVLPRRFIARIDDAVNYRLESFVVSLPYDDENGLVVYRPFHKQMNGNAELVGEQETLRSVEEKAVAMVGVTGEVRMVTYASDLCPL